MLDLLPPFKHAKTDLFWTVMEHYSPNLLLCDYHRFNSLIKEHGDVHAQLGGNPPSFSLYISNEEITRGKV